MKTYIIALLIAFTGTTSSWAQKCSLEIDKKEEKQTKLVKFGGNKGFTTKIGLGSIDGGAYLRAEINRQMSYFTIGNQELLKVTFVGGQVVELESETKATGKKKGISYSAAVNYPINEEQWRTFKARDIKAIEFHTQEGYFEVDGSKKAKIVQNLNKCVGL